jgi:hypothetical protein
MDDTTRSDLPDENADDVEAHGLKGAAAAGLTAATLAAAGGAASAHAATAPTVHKAPQAHAAAMKKSDPTQKAQKAPNAMWKFFTRMRTRSNATFKY